MPVDDFDVPEWVHNLLAEINLDDYVRAGTNVTIREINHLIRIAKDGRLDVETISKLYREANKFSGAGTVLTAGALVILVVFLCHPRVVSRPVLNALRLTAAGVATGMFLSVRLIPCIVNTFEASLVAKVQSHWSVKPLVGVLQEMAMRRYGGSRTARTGTRPSAAGDYLPAFKFWAKGNNTPSSKR